jgi:hypothetical protein
MRTLHHRKSILIPSPKNLTSLAKKTSAKVEKLSVLRTRARHFGVLAMSRFDVQEELRHTAPGSRDFFWEWSELPLALASRREHQRSVRVDVI